jgi:hypothetical protein
MTIKIRPDQLERMNDLAQRLTEVFLEECDPTHWPDLDSRDGRGDRLWLKKNAAKTLAIVTQLVFVGQRIEGRDSNAPTEHDHDLEQLIARAEQRAAAMLRAHDGGGKKTPH